MHASGGCLNEEVLDCFLLYGSELDKPDSSEVSEVERLMSDDPCDGLDAQG